MLFLLADFFEILVKRVLRFIDRKKKDENTNTRERFSGTLNEFSAPPSPSDVEQSLENLSRSLPSSQGNSYVCVVCQRERPHDVLLRRSNVSVQACQALDRIYGEWYLIQYYPFVNGA